MGRAAQVDLIAEALWEATQLNDFWQQQQQQQQQQLQQQQHRRQQKGFCSTFFSTEFLLTNAAPTLDSISSSSSSSSSSSMYTAVCQKRQSQLPFTEAKPFSLCPSRAGIRRCCAEPAAPAAAATAATAAPTVAAAYSAADTHRGPLLQCGATIGALLLEQLQRGPKTSTTATYGFWLV